jgi:hypothetical protein
MTLWVVPRSAGAMQSGLVDQRLARPASPRRHRRCERRLAFCGLAGPCTKVTEWRGTPTVSAVTAYGSTLSSSSGTRRSRMTSWPRIRHRRRDGAIGGGQDQPPGFSGGVRGGVEVTIHYEQRDHIALITIDRPETRGAMNNEVLSSSGPDGKRMDGQGRPESCAGWPGEPAWTKLSDPTLCVMPSSPPH